MTNSEHRTWTRELNTWVQTVGIVIASVWGVYTFVYKEVMIPRSAPINITLNLQLEQTGTKGLKNAASKESLVAIAMKVVATNPSSRTVYLFPSAWIAYGLSVGVQSDDNASFQLLTAESLSSDNINAAERHSKNDATTVVAVGHLLPDAYLRPSETAIRTVVFHVPLDKYDLVQVQTLMPTAANVSGIALSWEFDKDETLKPVMYRVSPSGTRTPMPTDPDGGYSDARLELQMATSISQLSLWR